MKRTIVRIDEERCDGCGLCIPNCHEGALQIIDGKARLVSDLFCDGLGACLGHCPQGAIHLEEREAQPYNEREVMRSMIPKGNNTLVAHLEHLRSHGEIALLKEGIEELKKEGLTLEVDSSLAQLSKLLASYGLLRNGTSSSIAATEAPSGTFRACPGSIPIELSGSRHSAAPGIQNQEVSPGNLENWPIQMHLINPNSGHFQGADLLLAADCIAFSMGTFHSRLLNGKKLIIACPKLDAGKEQYIAKIKELIDVARIDTLTVAMMEVPCCGGLMRLVEMAQAECTRKVPVKKVVVGIRGSILDEAWV